MLAMRGLRYATEEGHVSTRAKIFDHEARKMENEDVAEEENLKHQRLYDFQRLAQTTEIPHRCFLKLLEDLACRTDDSILVGKRQPNLAMLVHIAVQEEWMLT